jgi:uncharacterized surface protein with fasciclin (FAS1) repeats
MIIQFLTMDIFRIQKRGGLALTALLIVCGLWVLPACKKGGSVSASTVPDSVYFGRLPFVVQDNYTYSMYYAALVATGYSDTLGLSAGPYTILVPNNDAMKAGGFAYSNNSVNYFLQATFPSLSQYVQYYILPGQHFLGSIPLGVNQRIPSLLGPPVYVTKYQSGADTVITVNGSIVTAYDLPATNGLIDVISSVPEPQTTASIWQRMEEDPSLSYFVAAVQRAGLQSLFEAQDTTLTVLAPSNFAFSQIDTLLYPADNLIVLDSILTADPVKLRGIVLEHVLGGMQFMNDLNVAAGLIPDDSLKLTTLGGGVLTYTDLNDYPLFVSNTYTQNLGQYFNTTTGTFQYGFYGNPYLAQGSLYSTYFYDMPSISFKDRPTGNGILDVIGSVMLP